MLGWFTNGGPSKHWNGQYTPNFSGEIWGEEAESEVSLQSDVKLDLNRCVARVCTGFISFRIRLNGATFEMRWWNFGFSWGEAVSWPADGLSSFSGGFCSMEWGSISMQNYNCLVANKIWIYGHWCLCVEIRTDRFMWIVLGKHCNCRTVVMLL
jgi:hypothetical protein